MKAGIGDQEKGSRGKKDQPSRKQLEAEAEQMGNFTGLFPTGHYRFFFSFIPEGLTFGKHLDEKEHERRSQLFLSHTPETFFALIDSLIEKHHINPKDIDLTNADADKKAKVRKIAEPIFIELRLMGYTNYELTV